jgi:DNA-binding MarR family transcriptional regulator
VIDTIELQDARDLADALLRAGRDTQRKLRCIAARHDLTATQVMLLRSLTEPIAMSALADTTGCDPSNVTGLVDRTARLGLVQRLAAPGDRRVRLLSLTPEGERIRDLIDEELTREISGAFDGSPSERAELNRLLRRLERDPQPGSARSAIDIAG